MPKSTGVTNIAQDWNAGNMVYYEETVGRSSDGDVLTIGTTAVTVGGTGNDIDFTVYAGASTDYFKVDCGTGNVTIASTPSGTTAYNIMAVNVTDTMAGSGTGYQRGVYVNWTSSGDRTAAQEINGIGVDLTLGGNIDYAYCISLYAVDSGDPTLDLVEGISMYFDDLGSGINSFNGVEVGTAFSTNNPTYSSFYRGNNHSSNALTTCFSLRGGTGVPLSTYLFDFLNATTGPCVADTGAPGGAGTASHKITCRHNGVTFYLAGYADF